MSAPSGPVFEDNIARLLKRAYVPARSSERFRADLWSEIESGLDRIADREKPSPPRPLRRVGASVKWLGVLVAAAAVLVIAPLLVGDRSPRENSRVDGSRVRTALNAPFRSLAQPRIRATPARVEWDGSYLEIITEDLAVRAQRGAEVSLVLENYSHLVATAETGAIEGSASESAELALHSGRLRVERARADGSSPNTFALLGPDEVRVELDEGMLAARVADGQLHVEVLQGSALIAAGGRRYDLSVGEAWPDNTAAVLEAGPQRQVLEPVHTEPLEAEAATLPEIQLSGRVLDRETGDPVRRFDVHLLREQDYNSVSPPVTRTFESEDGRFEIGDVADARYEVSIDADGYALWRQPGLLNLSDAVPALEAALDRGITLRGYVLDAESGAPISGACVVSETDAPIKALELAPPTELPPWFAVAAITGSDGAFELNHLSAGNQVLRATANRYGAEWIGPIELGDGQQETHIFKMGPGASLWGTVYRDDGSNWAGTQIVAAAIDTRDRRVCMSYAFTEASDSGAYRFEDLPAGFTTIVVLGTASEAGQGPPKVVPRELEAGTDAQLDIGRPEGGVRLFGHVLDPNGDPVPNVLLSLGVNDGGLSSRNDWTAGGSNAEGYYQFGDISPGPHLIFRTLAMGRGLVLIETLTIPDWAELPHDIRLGERTVRGTVSTPDGTPLNQAFLLLTRVEPDGERTFAGWLFTDRTGSFKFSPLAEATYQLSTIAMSGTYAPDIGEHFAVGDADVELTVELEDGARAAIRVRDALGRPVENARVMPVDPASELELLRDPVPTDASGTAMLDNLPVGHVRLVVRTTSRGRQSFDTTLAQGDNDLTIELPPAPTLENDK